MPVLPDIHVASADTSEQLNSLVRQLNEWGRLISNESKTRVMRSDSSTEAIRLGELEDNEYGLSFSNGDLVFMTITKNGLLFKDQTGTPRAIFGVLADGGIGIVISKEGVDVRTLV